MYVNCVILSLFCWLFSTTLYVFPPVAEKNPEVGQLDIRYISLKRSQFFVLPLLG